MGVADAHLSSGNRAIPTISIAQATIPQQPNDDPHNGYRVSSRYFDWLSSMSENQEVPINHGYEDYHPVEVGGLGTLRY